MNGTFKDREEAGQLLAERLTQYADRADVIVLALPRGGVPVAWQMAQHLNLPLDVFVVRKLGVPGFEELALGAIASGGVRVLNEDVVRSLPDATALIDDVTTNELAELERREHVYRDGRPAPQIEGRTVILVDDGVATGTTMRAAVAALRQRNAAKITIAVPVGAAETCRQLQTEAEEVVCLYAPEWFQAVGQFYDEFGQTSDGEVRQALAAAAARRSLNSAR